MIKISIELFSQRLFDSNRKITNGKVIGGDACDTIIKMVKLHGQLNDIIDDLNSCDSIHIFGSLRLVLSFAKKKG